MPKDLFCGSLFIIKCIIGDKIMATILANIRATRYDFVDKKYVKFLKLNHNARLDQNRYKHLMVKLANLLILSFIL